MKAIECWLPRKGETSNLPLTDEQTEAAHEQLVHRVEAFPTINRRYIDPPIPGQKFALFSFIPAKDVVPNAQGFYGYAKIRGTFSTPEEAVEKSDEIIRTVDSTNSIYTCLTGHPIPLVVKGHAELHNVDMQKEVDKDISYNVRSRAMEERKKIEEMKEREEELRKDVSEPNPEDDYIAKRVKLAVLRFTISEHEIKKKESEELRDKCIKELIEVRDANPDYEKNHLEKYMNARKKAHIPEETDLTGFMKFMCEPIENSIPGYEESKKEENEASGDSDKENKPPYKCSTCSKKYKTSANYTVHIAVCTGKKKRKRAAKSPSNE